MPSFLWGSRADGHGDRDERRFADRDDRPHSSWDACRSSGRPQRLGNAGMPRSRSSAAPTASALVNSIPLPARVLLYYALAAVLVASPFVFGFSCESAPKALFMVLGVAHLLIRQARASGGRRWPENIANRLDSVIDLTVRSVAILVVRTGFRSE